MLWLAPTSSGCHSLLIDRDTLKMLSVTATKPRLLGKDKKRKNKLMDDKSMER